MASLSYVGFQVSCSIHERPSIPVNNAYLNLKTALCSVIKPLFGALLQKTPNIRIEHVSKNMKNTSIKILDALVDSMFEITDQPLLPSQKNFEPVDELGEAVVISSIEGNIPNNFPDGVYVRNGPNPLHGGLKSTKSMFGKSYHIWVEGEGMLHALYISKVLKLDDHYSNNDQYYWSVNYNNRYVQTETFTHEKLRNKPSFLPALGGDSLAVLSAYILNWLRFGIVNKYMSNTNVFEHSGKIFSIAENHMPHEIDISTLQTLGNWDLSRAWNRPFTSHPKRVPGTGELVTFGMAPTKPYVEIGVISADGKKLIHRVDIKLNRCPLCHDIGITERYNLIMDIPLTIDLMRLVQGGPLMKYNKEEYARIGVMPRYGDADSITWFDVDPNCTFHIINCFEDGDDEVVVWGCRALDSIISSTQEQIDTSTTNPNNSYHDSPYEWRLNMKNGQIKERKLTLDTEFSMDYPTINEDYTGLKNKFGYIQVVDPISTTPSNNLLKYCGLGKLHFAELDTRVCSTSGESKEVVKIEYHMFEKNTFCSGATFVSAKGGVEEDDGWIITFVHNEDTNISQVHVIDSKNFSSDPVAKITLPYRVPYGFHGTYVSM
ncbi:carotenoid 9,10(9',10')-cleavage dioxygenase-like [Humulus lupulus]|uniref:carotenoid 9,10(9',10')-cleavage dioxygenase-like n=1 Tax=Humulus lupulus TaxID=3486 RepID=UPI002B40C406|nr:carotenoid 9,10(9',10')-cleavage dioxygenase-like [Humulus lupulus]